MSINKYWQDIFVKILLVEKELTQIKYKERNWNWPKTWWTKKIFLPFKRME